VFFAWPLAGDIAAYITHALVAGPAKVAVGAAACVLMIVVVAWGLALHFYWRVACPQCGQPFYGRVSVALIPENAFTRSCLNCGIDVGTTKPLSSRDARGRSGRYLPECARH
jgi:hypothetical protein